MTVFSIFGFLLVINTIFGEEQSTKLPQMCRNDQYDIEKGTGYPTFLFKSYEVCKMVGFVSVESVYVADDFVQLFLVHSIGLTPSALNVEARIFSGIAYPEYVTKSAHYQSGRFIDFGRTEEDGNLKEVSASFLHFSDCVNEFGYLISGLSAYEFVIRNSFYYPTGKVKPITDFYKEDEQKLLQPEDELKEVVSVSLIKWVEKNQIKDHAIYKIILKTVTRKLVKAYFKLTSKGEVISLNSEPFLPSAELFEGKNELNFLEESALYYVGELYKLSMGYQFTKELAFPIYYDYNPETNSYKEYPKKTKTGFNAELETLADKIPHWNRYIVPTDTWLGCPERDLCLGRSFDAVFSHEGQYYAVFENLMYKIADTTEQPVDWLPIHSFTKLTCTVDAAFSLGDKFLFFKDHEVYLAASYNSFGTPKKISELFPDINATSAFPVSAVITLDKDQESFERPGKTMEEDVLRKNIFVFFTNKDGGNVYQYQIETWAPLKFKLVAKKPYKDVNTALPLSVSLVFTAVKQVVTMVHHFMIEQSSETFFSQTENTAKFTLIDKYLGCRRENVEEKLSKEFVDKYIEFAAPKPGATVKPDLSDTQERTKPQGPTVSSKGHCPGLEDSSKQTENVSTDSSEKLEELSSTPRKSGSTSVKDAEKYDKVKCTAISAKLSSAMFVIQAAVILLFI